MSLFAPTGGRAAKFPEPGATITGQLSAIPFEKQATKFGSQDLDFWPNGDPKMDIVVPLENTNVPREDSNDDGDRTIYVSSKNMRQAIAQAIQAAGQQDVAVGGTLTVTYVGNDPNSKNPANPAKLYQAQYTPPASGFATPAAPAAQQAYAQPAAPAAPQQPVSAPQQAYAQPMPQQPTAPQLPAQQPAYAQPASAPAAMPAAPAPATPAAGAATDTLSGLTAEQFDKAKQLLALGTLTDEQIASALGVTTEQITTAAGRPF